jgi:hypothetical protein
MTSDYPVLRGRHNTGRQIDYYPENHMLFW